MIVLLVGMTGFLIANVTNPYFGSFDFMWTIFLPIAYINLKLQKNKKLAITIKERIQYLTINKFVEHERGVR